MSGSDYFYIAYALTAFLVVAGGLLAWLQKPWTSHLFIGAIVAKAVYTDYLLYNVYTWTGTAFQSVFQALMVMTGRM